MKKDPIDWIDLDDADEEYEEYEEEYAEDEEDHTPQREANPSFSRSHGKPVNWHLLIIGTILLIFVVIVIKLFLWNKGEQDTTPDANPDAFNTESMDNIVPLDSSVVDAQNVDDDLNILFLGNGQLARDKKSSGNLANVIAQKSGATVYNCAIEGTYMAMKNDHYMNTFVYDAFSFYNLCTLFTVDNHELMSWAARDYQENTGDKLPASVTDSLDMLESINYEELDVLCIYYDHSDYLAQAYPFNDEINYGAHTYSGALEAGIALIKEAHPHVRIIVLSPTFVYVEDEDGNRVSSYDEDIFPIPLFMYVIHEQDTCYQNNVTFVDNFYGSIYEEVADRYLADNTNTNAAGTELLADRFLYALNRFNDYSF